MNNAEEINYKVKLKNGWRAIIYDAPWAYFKQDQDGVFISSDGKACETTDDNKDSIIVVVDPDVLLYERVNGHILFKQKGSDLFDIVCLYQEPGGTYKLEVSNVAIEGCTGNWDEFKNKVKVFEEINDVRRELSSEEYNILSPTPQFNFTNENSNDIVYTGLIIVTSKKFPDKTAQSDLTIKGTEKELCEPRKDDNNKIIGEIDLSKIEVENTKQSEFYYSISKSLNYSECTGKPEVVFKLVKEQKQIPQYTINLSSVKTTIMYDCKKCGEITRSYTYEITDINTLLFTITGNVTEIGRADGSIVLQIEDGVSEFVITAKSNDFNVTASAKFKRGQDSNFYFYEYI